MLEIVGQSRLYAPIATSLRLKGAESRQYRVTFAAMVGVKRALVDALMRGCIGASKVTGR